MSADDDSVKKRYPRASYTPLEDYCAVAPPPPVREDQETVAQFEYSFDLSCSAESLRKHSNCEFTLGNTKAENQRANWQVKPVEQGYRYTTAVRVEEPKHLYVTRACSSLGVTPVEPVTVYPKGAGQAQDAFVAVMPAVEIDGRLGHPTQGYFYHFCDGKLMQEYQILGDKRWAFEATHSTHDQLREDFYHGVQSAILLPWKRGGQKADNQYLVYRRERITRLHLDNLSEDWLVQNGVKIDLGALLDAIRQPVIKRAADDSKPFKPSAPMNHRVQRDPATGQRESWPDIARQYGLTARELLDLNPGYEENPLLLEAGHILTVQSPDAVAASEPVREWPPVPPADVNQPLNICYHYDGSCIEDTSIIPMYPHGLAADIPVVRIKSVVAPVFAKSCDIPQGCTNAGTSPEPITHFGPFSWFFSPAHASPVAASLEVQMASRVVRAANPGGAVGNNAFSSANKDAAIALTRLAGKLGSVLDDYRLMTSGGITSVLMMQRKIWHDDDTQHTEQELHNLESVQSRIRIRLTDPAPGESYPQVRAYHMNDTRIPVRYVGLDKKTNSYSVALEENGPRITWTPNEEGKPEWQLTPDHDDGFETEDIHTTPVSDSPTPTVETYPATEEAHWSDAILVFPDDSGIAPIYIVYKEDRRNQPGVVTGKGKDVPWEDGYWLGKAADEGQGQYIPTAIANGLRGREFKRFSDMQSAFWEEVANDPQLFKQFDTRNQKLILKGKAPAALPDYKWGKLKKFSLHHVEEIQHGGDVYNIDNLRVVTPRLHWGEIHGSKGKRNADNEK
ncbi:T6SS effector antibacterial DNase [Photobacterium halotolerans]|uniref:T6SS effector antibacterial DNase n=1 Tax=Photobacterium halotolerans TaxID=265726 RepID=UPI000418EFA1|nr:S-type pyocin domain-containing protein [Photobacterium halotolerans]